MGAKRGPCFPLSDAHVRPSVWGRGGGCVKGAGMESPDPGSSWGKAGIPLCSRPGRPSTSGPPLSLLLRQNLRILDVCNSKSFNNRDG